MKDLGFGLSAGPFEGVPYSSTPSDGVETLRKSQPGHSGDTDEILGSHQLRFYNWRGIDVLPTVNAGLTKTGAADPDINASLATQAVEVEPFALVSEGADAPGNTSTPYDIQVGDQVQGSLSYLDPTYVDGKDWYAVQLETQYTYVITLLGDGTSSTIDENSPVQLRLYNGAGSEIDVAMFGTDEPISFSPTGAGTYYVAVEAYDEVAANYTITVIAETLGNSGTTEEIIVGDPVSGKVDYNYDDDWYRVELEVGYTYVFTLAGDGTSSGMRNAEITMYSGGSAEVASGQIFAGISEPLTFTPTADGTYYIAMESWNFDERGNYIISSFAETANNENTQSAVEVNSEIAGVVDYEDDDDWHAVQLLQGYTYTFVLSGDGTSSGLNALSLELLDEDGDRIDSEQQTGSPAVISYTATSTGTYFLNVGSRTDETGNYILSVTGPIIGSEGGDVIAGTEEADDIYGKNGSDDIGALGGDDTVDAGQGGDTVSGGDGNDLIEGKDGSDSLLGDAGDDTLNGNNGRDTIDGGDGADVIDGGQQSDTLFGGDGNDTISGVSGGDFIDGGAGDDSISGDSGSDYLIGGDGNDTLVGGQNNDTLDGGAGNDDLDGRDGQESMIGGDGDDTMIGKAGADTLEGGAGNDSMDGGTQGDLMSGGADDDYLFGNANEDTLSGDDGNDTLDGGNGRDSLEGGAGNDSLDGGNGHDTVNGGDGDDTVNGGTGNDSVTGGTGNDYLTGGDGSDTILGGDGNDSMLGEFDVADGQIPEASLSPADDSLDGGAGEDLIVASGGTDTLTGGEGADLFLMLYDSAVITDFEDDVDSWAINPHYIADSGLSDDDFRDSLLGSAQVIGGNLVFADSDGNSVTFVGYTDAADVIDDLIFL